MCPLRGISPTNHSPNAAQPQRGDLRPLLLKIAGVAIPTLLALGTFFFLPFATAVGVTFATGLLSLFAVLSCCPCCPRTSERTAIASIGEEPGFSPPPPEWPEGDVPLPQYQYAIVREEPRLTPPPPERPEEDMPLPQYLRYTIIANNLNPPPLYRQTPLSRYRPVTSPLDQVPFLEGSLPRAVPLSVVPPLNPAIHETVGSGLPSSAHSVSTSPIHFSALPPTGDPLIRPVVPPRNPAIRETVGSGLSSSAHSVSTSPIRFSALPLTGDPLIRSAVPPRNPATHEVVGSGLPSSIHSVPTSPIRFSALPPVGNPFIQPVATSTNSAPRDAVGVRQRR